MISQAQLQAIMPYCSRETARIKSATISEAMIAFGIDQTNQRIAMYIAQVAVETGELRYVRETTSGAQYEGRRDLGNVEPGDGVRFPGRGDLEITGRGNYVACSLALYGDARLLESPELLELAVDGSNAGGWYWQSHGLSLLADTGDFLTVSVRINGRGPDGYPNGWAQRQAYFARARGVL